MKRLKQNIGNYNTASDYDQIFMDRLLKPYDKYDLKRWKFLMKYYGGGRLVDLGCLDSQIPQMAKKKYPRSEIWALDQAKEPIEYYQDRYPDIYYIQGDLYNTNFPTSHFSYAVLGEVLEHLEDPEKAVSEAFRILRPGGTLAVSVPLGETGIGEVDRDRHLWSFTMGDMVNLLKPYSSRVRTKVIGSENLGRPNYKYHFPCLIGWGIKKE